ncbi:unnamed protein product [Gulo gulo]|uniref:Uncharacterized protein n=1 Tax=Gulo gulo TaxID=48420 RepID=A0A9X9MBD7_GULGU|nr:unnamed protein product [Gulo gulo]
MKQNYLGNRDLIQPGKCSPNMFIKQQEFVNRSGGNNALHLKLSLMHEHRHVYVLCPSSVHDVSEGKAGSMSV